MPKSLKRISLETLGLCALMTLAWMLFARLAHAETVVDPSAAAALGTPHATITEYGILDAKHRATLGVGANYEWWSAEGQEPAPPYRKEFSFGAYGSWNLVPPLSAVGSVVYLTDNNLTRTTLGGNYTFFRGLFDLGVGLQYEFLAGRAAPSPGKEFTVGLRAGYPINRWLVATGSCFYATDSKMYRSALGLRAILLQPKNK